ncbi:MAG TPA: hypothetical protein VL832_01755 [Puia sp.]|jgi:hypothetical protein|nr:hypothetical protein [Puia sp.]
MKNAIPLKRFEYSIPDAAIVAGDARNGQTREMVFQLANVDIDFEKRNLSLTGKGLKVKATIYPGFAVDLTELSEDGLVFSLEGIMEYHKCINSCSGLLVLDSMPSRYTPGGKEWQATVYLYDDYDDEREIRFRLPMFSHWANAELN